MPTVSIFVFIFLIALARNSGKSFSRSLFDLRNFGTSSNVLPKTVFGLPFDLYLSFFSSDFDFEVLVPIPSLVSCKNRN